ncbi:MAG: glycosyltransferase [Rhodobacterales bacterium]|nr:glycosyltransferase [Rhodobacterales bacterium]
MLSLVVIAKNEADRLESCLNSVDFAVEKIVVESGSSDRTVEVAEAAGAKVICTDWPGHVAQKNRALALATQPWVLSLDADERLSPEAASQLREALANPGDAVGFSFPRCSTWLGTAIRHGRWYPDRKLRVVRRGLAKWGGDDPHDQLRVDGPVVRLTGDILHTPYRNFGEHMNTIDRYSEISARVLTGRGVRGHWYDIAFRPPLHFVDAYVVRRGCLDGVSGLALAGLGSAHVLAKWTRVWLRSRET